VRVQIPRAEAALSEAERKIDDRVATFRAETQKELNDRRTMLEGLSELQAADHDRIRRTEIAAPMRATVKQIHLKTVGGVARPGQDLVELVPVEDTLLVEVRIRPADVGFVHVGQHASVKVTAFDYAIYGQLAAKVEDISADSIGDETDRTREPYFRVRLRTEKNALGPPDRPLLIHPGMTVSADIQTGERTVLTYLLKPIFKTLTSAMGER
jgi:adhesin transport system membrane fusion protein